MARFTLAQLFSRWTPVSTAPARSGWYRTRTEPLSHGWWNDLAYWDGAGWWHYGSHAGLTTRVAVQVLQWQGLCMPASAAGALVKANLPKTARARRNYRRFLTVVLRDDELPPALLARAA